MSAAIFAVKAGIMRVLPPRASVMLVAHVTQFRLRPEGQVPASRVKLVARVKQCAVTAAACVHALGLFIHILSCPTPTCHTPVPCARCSGCRLDTPCTCSTTRAGGQGGRGRDPESPRSLGRTGAGLLGDRRTEVRALHALMHAKGVADVLGTRAQVKNTVCRRRAVAATVADAALDGASLVDPAHPPAYVPRMACPKHAQSPRAFDRRGFLCRDERRVVERHAPH